MGKKVSMAVGGMSSVLSVQCQLGHVTPSSMAQLLRDLLQLMFVIDLPLFGYDLTGLFTKNNQLILHSL